ncbi:patatin-like phospholipase family protein [Rhodobacter sp. NTK016B]|uniref:patatin-like phospholipase family protein n=1 Tax=Rhodobacter sp. NTK016B TaxID=2759676 RepID=UPI001A8D1C62|nr:patatin-like phospholipase family protein [Rhodobacter sp. NTK016B]MBN8294306.1 patatin-like phospholipase family protein [Rhodobacter sp. NTK016B]
MKKPVIGLALGSGGARGWCHIGVLRELEAMGIRPDVVAGSSMGALVGAAYAAGKLDALEDWATGLTLRTILPLIDVGIAGAGLVGGAGILTMLKGLNMPETIEELALPFVAVATELRHGREIWLRKGKLATAVRASVSIPGLLRPQLHEGRWLIDGGVVNPVPVSAARALGAEAVIAVNPDAGIAGGFYDVAEAHPRGAAFGAMIPEALRNLWTGDKDGAKDGDTDAPQTEPDPPEPSYMTLAMAVIDIMSEQIRRSRLAGDPPQVLLGARLKGVSIMDLHRAPECIEEGRRLVRAQADHMEIALGL